MRTTKVKTDPDLLARLKVTSPRAAVLYEATGHLGPWTYDEYASVLGFETITPERHRPDPPADVVAGDAELDRARLAYEAATNAWTSALLAQRRHFDRGGKFIVVQGYGLVPEDRKGKTLAAEVDKALEARADAEKVLAVARRDATRLRDRWLAEIQ